MKPAFCATLTAWTEDRAVRRAFLLEIRTFPLHCTHTYCWKFIHSSLRSLPLGSNMLWAYFYQFDDIRTEKLKQNRTKKTEIDVKYDNIRLCSFSQFLSLAFCLSVSLAFLKIPTYAWLQYHNDTLYHLRESTSIEIIPTKHKWIECDEHIHIHALTSLITSSEVVFLKETEFCHFNNEECLLWGEDPINKQRIPSIVLFYYLYKWLLLDFTLT